MVKIVAIALVSAIIIIYLKSINSELYSIALVGAGVILVGVAFDYITEIFTFFNSVAAASGIDKEIYMIIFKVVAIGYLVEFGADTINDLGFKGLAEKLIFVGKIAIFSISLPILYAVFNLLTEMLK